MKIEASNLSYVTGGNTILSSCNVSLDPGQTCVLLGPNGAGKSTLLRLLSGFLQPSTGSVTMNGSPVRDLSLGQRARGVGVLTQRSNLDFPFSAQQVVAMGRTPYGLDDGKDGVTQELLTLLGIDGRQIYTTLSGGEKQIVQFARVLNQVWGGGEGCYLMLDEPLAALDLKYQAKVAAILEQVKMQGTGQLIVVHDINMAAEIADRILLMSGGKLIQEGTVQECLHVDSLEKTFDVGITEITDGDRKLFMPSLQ